MDVFDDAVVAIREGLGEVEMPHDFSVDANILSDRVYTRGYSDIRHMILVLRELVGRSRGRGATRLAAKGRVTDSKQ